MSLTKLNAALLNQLDRLDKDDLSGEKLQDEIHRANAITGVASKMIDLGHLSLNAAKLASEYGMKALPTSLKESFVPLEKPDVTLEHKPE